MNNLRIPLLLKVISIAVLSAMLQSVFAQRPKSDEIKTDKGSLLIQPVQHGSLVFTWDKKIVYVDPYGGAKAFEGIAPPDMILITDIHGDHMSLETLKGIETSKAAMLVPKAVADQLPEEFKKQLIIINNGEKKTQLEIEIEAVPMYNLPETADSRHPKGRGNGYILNIGGKRVYICGDTEDIPEMRALKNIDIAFICMNGPTMDINQAASAVLDFKPTIVYPFHYRESDTEAFKKLVQNGNPAIDVRLRNWYPKSE